MARIVFDKQLWTMRHDIQTTIDGEMCTISPSIYKRAFSTASPDEKCELVRI